MAEVLPRRPEPPSAREWAEAHTEGWEDSDAESIEVFAEDADEEADTTAAQHARGKDVQGIPWDRLHFSREQYRGTRLTGYNNYLNLEDQVKAGMEVLGDLYKHPRMLKGEFFGFWRNHRAVHSSIVHFQLRNLLWATSAHDVYVMLDSCINHWSPVTRSITRVMHLGGPVTGPALPLGRVQVSTMTAGHGLLAAGGFTGELALKNLSSSRPVSMVRVTNNENSITNGLELFAGRSGATLVMASNNDAQLRCFDAASLKCISQVEAPWAVNYAVVHPGGGGNLTAIVGDAPEVILLDYATGKRAATLEGHLDFSFAAAWHPDGRLLATGNQDTTTRVWDVRMTRGSLAVLKGRMGAVRSLRFSPDGRFLAVAEPADFVTLYDATDDFDSAQEIDLFGEVAGTAFSPDGERFFVAIADLTYSSLLEYHLADSHRGLGSGFDLVASQR